MFESAPILLCNAWVPTAILDEPDMFELSVSYPIDVLFEPLSFK